MIDSKRLKILLQNKTTSTYLNYLFFTIIFIELIAEHFHLLKVILILKIVPIPLLMILYCCNTPKISPIYLIALFLNWLTNFFFALHDIKVLLTASILFVFCRILFLFLIYNNLNFRRIIPFLLGCIPFLFMFLSLINLIFLNLSKTELYTSLIHSVIMTIFGGFALSNFILKNDISSKFLLLSSLFFTINLIILGIKFYYIDYNILKPISFFLFVLGQYTFYKFLILSEKSLSVL